jgi:hypothetical protein
MPDRCTVGAVIERQPQHCMIDLYPRSTRISIAVWIEMLDPQVVKTA